MYYFFKCFKILTITIVITNLFSPVIAQTSNKFGFQFSGGMNYSTIGGLNHHNVDWNKSRQRSVDAAGGTVINESQELHWGGEFNGKLRYNILPKFALSVGVGYIYSQLLNDVAETKTAEITYQVIHDLKATAFPISIGTQYLFHATSHTNLSIMTSVDYYIVSFEKLYRRDLGNGYWIDNHFAGDGNGIGISGGLSFQYNVSKYVAIFIEGQGRYANIIGISGSRGRIDSNDWSDFVDGDFYEFEREREEGVWSRVFNVYTDDPSGDNIRKVKEAALDFSGFNIKLGVNFNIF